MASAGRWLALGVIGTVLGAGALATARAEEPPAAAPGMLIHRDPVTGKLGMPPPEAVTPPSETVERPPVALPETPGTTPAGGVKVDLQKRFQFQTSATVGPDGKLHVECGER